MLYIILTFFGHLLITIFSLVYHGTINKYFAAIATDTELYIPSIISSKYTIILVHGRNGHWSTFRYIIDKLHLECLDADILGINLGNNGQTTFKEDADILSNRLKDIDSKFILIGLSKGGLVVSQYTVDNPNRVKMVVTISSPLQGTKIASIHPTNKMIRDDLGWHSNVICELMDNVNKCSIPFYHIVPTWDCVIIPATSAKYLSTPNSNIYTYTGFYSHPGITHSDEVIDKITDWIVCYNKLE